MTTRNWFAYIVVLAVSGGMIPTVNADNPSRYEQLKTKFNAAKAVSASEIDGGYTGRCYTDDGQGPHSSLLATATAKPKTDDPVFPGSIRRVLILHEEHTPIGTYFDDPLSKWGAVYGDIQRRWKNVQNKVTGGQFLVVDPVTLWSNYLVESTVRKDQSIFYVHGTVTIVNPEPEYQGDFYCYYFKRVLPDTELDF